MYLSFTALLITSISILVPLTSCLRDPARAVLTVAPNTPDLTTPVRMLEYCGAKSTGFTLYPETATKNQIFHILFHKIYRIVITSIHCYFI